MTTKLGMMPSGRTSTPLGANGRRRNPNAAPARRGRRDPGIAPAPVRVLVIAVLVAIVAALVGGSDGFWLALPGVLLAGSVASSGAATIAVAAPVLIVDALAAGAVHRGPVPPFWLVVLVPALCLLVQRRIVGGLRAQRDALQDAAFSDPLTGLANRRMFLSMAEYEIARHQRTEARFIVVMIDLDGFKQVNDRFGHDAGDELLCSVGEALRRGLRTQDTVARLGGDEFSVIAPETENPRALAEKIRDAVAGAAEYREGVGASIGVAVFPEDGTTIDLLLRTADARLLAAKRRHYAGSQTGAERRGEIRAARQTAGRAV